MQTIRKGRGAASNRAGRYERARPEAFDDGWGTVEDDPPPLRTTVTEEAPRHAITRNDSPDIGFDRSINPYRGCEHGCIYCYARPSHAWLGLSPGLDFESRLFAKPNAPSLLEQELARPGYRCRVLAIGTNTDAYQPIEARYEVMRGILEVLARCRHPVTITTKSALVLRDRDLLADMARDRLAHVTMSVTTLDRRLARHMEPRAATPARRLEAVAELREAGIPVAVNFAPIIPALNDHELEAVLKAARQVGAVSAGYTMLRLPLEIADLFREWLEVHAPDRAARVLSRVRDMRGGLLYKSGFHTRMKGEGPYAETIAKRFALACRRLGLERGYGALDETRFCPPGAQLQLAL
ncbi:MAG: PA0069 family radical SAM protein [Alphaproteobacteria bacterium]|nr:PA0069 family radical SAM protein [Alphaproteobacteria bacterium]